MPAELPPTYVLSNLTIHIHVRKLDIHNDPTDDQIQRRNTDQPAISSGDTAELHTAVLVYTAANIIAR